MELIQHKAWLEAQAEDRKTTEKLLGCLGLVAVSHSISVSFFYYVSSFVFSPLCIYIYVSLYLSLCISDSVFLCLSLSLSPVQRLLETEKSCSTSRICWASVGPGSAPRRSTQSNRRLRPSHARSTRAATAMWLWLSKPMGSHFGVFGAPPILEPMLVGIGMFTGGMIWLLTHGHVQSTADNMAYKNHCGRYPPGGLVGDPGNLVIPQTFCCSVCCLGRRCLVACSKVQINILCKPCKHCCRFATWSLCCTAWPWQWWH